MSEEVSKRRESPKFGSNGSKYGTKSERKHRNNHKNRRRNAKLMAINATNSHQMIIRELS